MSLEHDKHDCSAIGFVVMEASQSFLPDKLGNKEI